MTATDGRCPHCGVPNRAGDATAEGPARTCSACGASLADPVPSPTASIARRRLLDDSPLARLPLKPAAPTWPPDGLCPLPTGPSRPLPAAPPAVLPRPRMEPFPARRVAPVPRGTPRPRSLLASLVWLVGVLGLLAVAAAQAVWQRPELLDLAPEVRAVAEWACGELGCALPRAADRTALRVESSTLEPLEGVPGVSALRLGLVNRSVRPQEPPGLRLTLLDAADNVVARRVFRPEEYLRGGELLAPGSRAQVELTLDAPETEFAGYRVDLAAR
ncbi:MAG: DUF3426 domain-containing protein [Gammaproteobacteria bacterium]|jgi:hypothetical protein|nr:DUF3426 domain-containing protein [Gammaproteobacteria bacterium]